MVFPSSSIRRYPSTTAQDLPGERKRAETGRLSYQEHRRPRGLEGHLDDICGGAQTAERAVPWCRHCPMADYGQLMLRRLRSPQRMRPKGRKLPVEPTTYAIRNGNQNPKYEPHSLSTRNGSWERFHPCNGRRKAVNTVQCSYCKGTGDDPYNEDCWCPLCKGARQQPSLDPEAPAVKHAARVISEIIWRNVLTHSAEECAELLRRVEENRAARDRLFGRPRIGDLLCASQTRAQQKGSTTGKGRAPPEFLLGRSKISLSPLIVASRTTPHRRKWPAAWAIRCQTRL
jgi:hypothetical protein